MIILVLRWHCLPLAVACTYRRCVTIVERKTGDNILETQTLAEAAASLYLIFQILGETLERVPARAR